MTRPYATPHAYTLSRDRPNSRVKDLPDIALLATARDIDGTELRAAIDRTFENRTTHPVPELVPAPSAAWEPVYARIASNDGLEWRKLEEVTRAVQSFLDPVLMGAAVKWEAATWTWTTARENGP